MATVTINEDLINRVLDHSYRNAGFGGYNASTYAAYYGFHLGNGAPLLPPNTDNNGFIFFTRPDMNLSYNNVSVSRRLSALTNDDPFSMANAIRCMLNPPGYDRKGDANRSKIFNDRQAFMTVLSNTCLTFSGVTDLSGDVWTSPQGLAKEQIALFDDRPDKLETWTATSTHVSMEGDPIMALFMVWWETMARCAEGTMTPFAVNLVEGRKDYETGITRFVMDRSRRYIQRWVKTIAFPTMVQLGSTFDFDRDKVYNVENNVISQNWQCQGLQVMDPMVLLHFNENVDSFLFPRANPMDHSKPRALELFKEAYMYWDRKSQTPGFFKKIMGDELKIFGQYAYPWVEEDLELSWYVETGVYDIVNQNSKHLEELFRE